MKAGVRLRVMTLNIRQLRDDPRAVVEVLRDEAPDVVAIQEPPRTPVGRWRLRRAADAAGLVPLVSGKGARTTALLVRPGLTANRPFAMRLPWTPWHTPRGIAVADVEGVRVISVHLGLTARDRAAHLVRILPVVRSAPAGGCIVAGDLNELPGGPSWRRLLLDLRDLTPTSGPTYPATGPTKRIDAILGSKELVGSGGRVVDSPAAHRASDHRPVVVDVVRP